MRARLILVVSALLLAAVPAPASADVQAKKASVVTDVREETWKDEPTIDGAGDQQLPKTPVAQGVYRNPYYQVNASHRGVIGNYLGLTIQLPSVSSDSTSPDSSKYLVTAEIKVPGRDDLEAKMTKEAPDTFYAEFDLDGSADGSLEPLPPGVFDIVVEVYYVSSDPLHGAERVGRTTFEVTNDPGRATSAFLSLFPTDVLRKWKGIGGFENVPLTSQRPTDKRTQVGFSFPASSNVSAEISVFLATRRTPQGPTGGSGEVVVDKEVLFSQPTTSAGTIRTSLTPSEVLDGKDGDLIVVAGYLAGNGLDVGSSVLVVPASDATAEIVGYTPVEFGGPAGSQTDGFDATIEDQSGGSRTADAVALYPSGTLIAKARNVRSPPAEGDVYHANFAYQDIRDDSPVRYRIYSLLYKGSQQDSHEFHALARAQRGLSFSAPLSLQVQPGSTRDIPVTITSAYTNHNAEREFGMQMEATLTATGLPGQGNYSQSFLINESRSVQTSIPFSATDPGSYTIGLNVSAAEVDAGQTITITVPDGDSSPLSVPGFTGAWLLIALAAAGVLIRRRR